MTIMQMLPALFNQRLRQTIAAAGIPVIPHCRSEAGQGFKKIKLKVEALETDSDQSNDSSSDEERQMPGSVEIQTSTFLSIAKAN